MVERNSEVETSSAEGDGYATEEEPLKLRSWFTLNQKPEDESYTDFEVIRMLSEDESLKNSKSSFNQSK